MGTRLGVSRFDGLTFENFSGTDSVRFGKVFSISGDAQQYIWIGAEHGLFFYHAGIIKKIQLENFPDEWIYSVLANDDNSLWLGTANGPVLITQTTLNKIREGGKLNYKLFENWRDFADPGNQVFVIDMDEQGSVYFGTRGSVIKYDKKHLSKIWQSRESSLEDVSSIQKNTSDAVYIGTRVGYFYKVSGFKTDTLHSFTYSGGIAKISDEHYYVLAVDKLFEWKNEKSEMVYDFSLNGYDNLSDILIDRENNIWVATWEGLVKLRKNIFTTFLPGVTENLNDIFSVLPTENGYPVFGGNKGNVIVAKNKQSGNEGFIFSPADIKFDKFLPNGIKPWDQSEVFGIFFCTNTIWFGSGYQGISAWDKQSKKMFQFDETVLKDMHGQGFFYDEKNNFYCMSEGGLTQIFNENEPAHATFKYFPWPIDIGGQYLKIFDHAVLAGNQIYLATNFGLVYFNGDTLLDVKINNVNLNDAIITSLVVIDDTTICVATGNYGIYFICPSKTSARVVEQINEKNGLLSDAVLDLRYDSGRLWCAHYSGISLLRRDQQNFKVIKLLDEADGFLPYDFTYIKMSDYGPLWLATTNGVQVLLPSDIQLNTVDANPVIRKVLLFNGALNLADYATGIDPDRNLSYHPILPYNKNSLTFQFQSLSLTSPGKNKCRYKLHGYDTTWAYANGLDEVTFAALAPGEYVFILQAANNDGQWSKLFDTYAFTIKKPYWATWWFMLLLSITIFLISYSIYKYRINHLIKINSMRNKIAGDLHDDIGSTLSSISMYSEIIKNQLKNKAPESSNLLNKITENSKEMIGNMSDIVWAIKPSNDSFKNIEERMFNFATELCNAKEIELLMEPNSELENLKIPMEHRRDLYLIFKEAVNNAIKYAGCTNLIIRFDKKGNKLEMLINDNGKGFDSRSVKSGNGLGNMKRRAELHGWELAIKSAEGKGTEVSLKI